MKLKYLNFTAVKKFARDNEKRLSTNFLQALDAHCTNLLNGSVQCAKETTTLTSQHVSLAARKAE